MLNCLNNDSKIQMKQNIQLHRQKLLQYLEKANDAALQPKLKLLSNDIKKIASTTELQKPKPTQSTISVINFKDKSKIRVKTYKPVLNTKAKNPEVLTDIDVEKGKTRSSNTLNQLQPNDKINKREGPLSNVKLKLEPLPKIEIPLPNIESKDSKPPITVKKLKEQLIEELLNSSSSDEIDDNISVGNNDNWNEFYQTHCKNNYEIEISSVSSNSSPTEGVRYNELKQLANDISDEEYLSYSGDSENSVLNINYPITTKISRNRKKLISKKSDYQFKRFRKPLDRTIHNAKERACRERIARRFDVLKNCCSYLNTNRRIASKHSILLAAKKECDLLVHFEQKMIAEKNVWSKANEVLKKKIVEFHLNNLEKVN